MRADAKVGLGAITVPAHGLQHIWEAILFGPLVHVWDIAEFTLKGATVSGAVIVHVIKSEEFLDVFSAADTLSSVSCKDFSPESALPVSVHGSVSPAVLMIPLPVSFLALFTVRTFAFFERGIANDAVAFFSTRLMVPCRVGALALLTMADCAIIMTIELVKGEVLFAPRTILGSLWGCRQNLLSV